MRRVLAVILCLAMTACAGGNVPPPPPPSPPPTPGPTPPPDDPCRPNLDPAKLPPFDDRGTWTRLSADPIMEGQVLQAIDDAQRMCPSAWDGLCLIGGPPSIDGGFALLAAALHAADRKGGQAWESDGRLLDTLALEIPGSSRWESYKVFAYTTGCIRLNRFDSVWEYEP